MRPFGHTAKLQISAHTLSQGSVVVAGARKSGDITKNRNTQSLIRLDSEQGTANLGECKSWSRNGTTRTGDSPDKEGTVVS